MWHDYLYSQRNKAAKSIGVLGFVCVCVEGGGGGRGGWSNFENQVIR